MLHKRPDARVKRILRIPKRMLEILQKQIHVNQAFMNANKPLLQHLNISLRRINSTSGSQVRVRSYHSFKPRLYTNVCTKDTHQCYFGITRLSEDYNRMCEGYPFMLQKTISSYLSLRTGILWPDVLQMQLFLQNAPVIVPWKT